jgi:aminopeptidase N
MEHHPYWHVAKDAMSDENTHVHEAAHGWFGDGIRLRCWEDFVLSEGTVSYLAAHVLGQVGGPTLEAAQWKEYQSELDDAIAEGGAPAWPTGCNQIDILKDKLFTNLPYMEGAFFYKDVADAVGADKLDQVLSDFYMSHRGRAAGMQDMIDLIQQETGFDPSALVESRLRKKF